MDSYIESQFNLWRNFRQTPLTTAEHKITEDLFSNSKGFALTITLCFAIGIHTVWGYVPHLWVAAFVILFIAEVITKIAISERFRQSTPLQQRSPHWRLILVFGSFWSGAVYGVVALVIFLPVTTEERLLLIAVFFGIIQVAAMSGSFFQWTTGWMLVPAVIPTIIALFVVGTKTTLLLALMLIVSSWSAVLLGQLSASRLRYITNLNEDNERLLHELSEERKIVDAEREKAEQAVIKNSHFMAVASHDLRQPLHAIGLFHHELKNMDKTRDPSEYYESIERSMDVLNRMFDSLLDISQLDAKAVVPQFQAIDSNSVFEAFVEEARSAATQKNLILESDLQDSVINTDPLLLGRIIRNLLGNAVKFTQKGVVTVRTRETTNELQVDIADTGIGISASDKSKIFAEFYQVKKNIGRQNGVGLGLSIVERLCQLLGITLSMESNQPVGTVFTLRIPLSDNQPFVKADTLKHVTNNLENLIIVFVDDDDDIRSAMEMLFERLGCYCLCFSGPEGVSELITEEGIVPDLLICDYQLNTQQTGLDLIEQTRKLSGTNIPALIVSGEVSANLSIQCREASVPLISKPVSPDVLKQEIAKIMSSKQEK